MADGFHTKDIDKSYQICCHFLGKKITIRKTINTKLKNIFYEYTYLVAIHKYTLKKSATNFIPSSLLPPKGKVHAEKCEICERVQLLQKVIIGK